MTRCEIGSRTPHFLYAAVKWVVLELADPAVAIDHLKKVAGIVIYVGASEWLGRTVHQSLNRFGLLSIEAIV